MTLRIGIVLPCYNVEGTVSRVVDSLCGTPLPEGAVISRILAIDNHSEDRTLEKLQEAARRWPEADLTLLKAHANYGYGASVKTGFARLLEAAPAVTHILVMHADAQCESGETAAALVNAAILDPRLDAVLTNRFSPASNTREYQLARRLGNHAFNQLTHVLTGFAIPDAGSAIGLFRAEALRRLPLARLTDSWQFHPELNLCLYVSAGFRIQELPIRWRNSEAPSSLRLVPYGIRLASILAGFAIKNRLCGLSAADSLPAQATPQPREYDTVWLSGLT